MFVFVLLEMHLSHTVSLIYISELVFSGTIYSPQDNNIAKNGQLKMSNSRCQNKGSLLALIDTHSLVSLDF